MSAVSQLDTSTNIAEYQNNVPAGFTLAARLLIQERDTLALQAIQHRKYLNASYAEIGQLRNDLNEANVKANGLQMICLAMALGYLAILANTYLFGA